ncbi:MAG TPA: cache domain-containing protein [Methylomirabilota bacterium]|jgi:hypothetical protein
MIPTAWRTLWLLPSRAPRRLERLAAISLRAEAQDSRLGDLSEKYMRTHERARTRLGTGPVAMVAAHLAADLHYLIATANVVLFARAVDPCLRLAEKSTSAFITLELREGTMTMLRVATGRLVLPTLLLLGSVLLINSAVNVWYTWRQTEALVARLHREKAETAATLIEQFLQGVQSQIGWTTSAWWAARPLDERRVDYLRLTRQVPAIIEVAQLGVDGKEVLRVSRVAMDTVGGGADFAGDVRFLEARDRRAYFGPVYFRKQTEPSMSLAMAHGRMNDGVTLAEVNLKPVRDIVRAIEVGKAGYAYIVDSKGRLIAHRDDSLVLRQPDLSSVSQVAAALASPRAVEAVEGTAVGSDLSGPSVLSVHAVVPSPGWRVFVELPLAEARASRWSALVRGLGLLGLGLAAAVLASLLAGRRIVLARPARA